MEPTTQAPLVGGLAALLLLLLLVRSVGRRRRAAAAEVRPEPQPQQHVEPESAGAVAEPLVEPEQVAEPERSQHEQAENAEQDEDTKRDENVEQPVEARRRGLFGRRRRRGEPTAEPVVDVAESTESVEPATADEAAADVELPAVELRDVELPAVEALAGETPEQAEVRALREQLRALERVVQQQASEPPTAALALVEETAAEQSAAYLRQVSLVVRGLAEHTDEAENPRRTLARVAAAVERLGVPNQMERPILPVTNELTARPGTDGSGHPSHRREVTELGVAAGQVAAPTIDVFAGLDLAAHVPAPVEAPVQAPLRPPAQAQVSVEPGRPESASPTQEPATVLEDAGPFAAYPPETDGGLPAYDEPPAVLPVPAPAVPEPVGRRRGRRSR